MLDQIFLYINKINKAQKIFIGVLIFLFLTATGVAYYFYDQSKIIKENSAQIVQDKARNEAKDLIAKISRLIVLPEGEEPVVATVADPERLKEQVFFTNAKKGDKVLIYTNAKKAILYDPVADKILEVAPLNIGVAPAASSKNE